jgi:hypothetical protein
MAPDEIKPDNAKKTPPDREWTVMILFAGDNDLAALLVSQVKAIKDAGFHEKVDVLLHIDPSERGVPTRLLHVNNRRRSRASNRTSIGSGGDSFVRNMGEDTITAQDVNVSAGEFSKNMKKALEHPDSVNARASLENFLGYCHENHPAKNYMLFLFGHGLVVGNDAFLPDRNPHSGVKLSELGDILRTFADRVKKDDDAELHLVGMHSCAMSAIEVAYELKGAARFMIGAEGIAYVGSWPYQNLLVKIFKALKQAQDASAALNIPDLVEKLYFHALHNGTDFVYMGYSLDLTLCSLEPRRYEALTLEIRELVSALKAALDTSRGREMILLAHWEAQSYWDENYTDLYDFCLCLGRRCGSLIDTLAQCASLLHASGLGADSPEVTRALEQLPDVVVLRRLAAACGAVKDRLEATNSVELEDGRGPVVFSKNVGSEYQYSHGLSVYFPWSKPLDDGPPPPPPLAIQSQKSTPDGTAGGVLDNYREYKFSQTDEFGADTWLSFLEDYFKKTERDSRPEEEGRPKQVFENLPAFTRDLRLSHALGALEKPSGGTEKPSGGSGSTCSCPTIKNYPKERLTLDGRNVEVRTFYVSDQLLEEETWRKGE